MDLPDCPPGAEGYQDSVTEVPKKPEDPICTKAEQEFQEHLNSLKIKLDDGSTRPMVERSGRDISGKWIYLCYPCAAVCSGESILQDHISGKKHKTKLAMTYTWPKTIFEDHPYNQNNAKTSTSEKVLQKMAQAVDVHNQTTCELEKKFSKYRNVTCHLQESLDAVKAPLIGLEYLIEHPPEQAHHEPKYICTLCSKQGHPRTIINHMTCFWHRYNYFLRHFRKACHILTPYRGQSKYREGVGIVVNRLAQRIEDKYGRMRPLNIDTEEYEKDKERIHQWIFKGQHFEEKEGCSFAEVVDIGLIDSLHESSHKERSLNKKEPSPPVVAAPSKPHFNHFARPAGRQERRTGSIESLSDISDDPDTDPRRVNKAPRLSRDGNEDRPRGSSPFRSRFAIRNNTSSRKSQEKVRPPNYEYKVKLASDMATAAEEFAKKTLAYHAKNPEKHPLYPEEWKKFWNRRYKEIQAEGKDPSKHDFKPEWIVFWTARMKVLHDEELRVAVNEIYRKMCLSPPDMTKKSPEPSSRSGESRRIVDVGRRLDDSRRRSPLDKRRRSPNARRRSPESRRRSPDFRRRSPDLRRRSPVLRHRSPEIRHRSPEIRHRSPLRRRSPDIRRDRRSPPVRRSPGRRRSPERRRSPIPHRLRTRSRSPVRRHSPPGRSARGAGDSRRSCSPLSAREMQARNRSPDQTRDLAPSLQTVLVSDDELKPDDGLSPWNSDNEIVSVTSGMSLADARSRTGSTRSRPARPRSRSHPVESSAPDDVVATLRLLVALEDYLGSLGPKLVDLLAEALKMEKEKANSSEELLVRESAMVLIETAKEKLKGAAQAGLVSGSAASAARAAVVRAAATLHEADKRMRADNQKSTSTAPVKSVVPVAGVGEVDRAQIAQQMAEALIAQGKTDVSSEELAQLVEAVVGMAEAKKREAERKQPDILSANKNKQNPLLAQQKMSGTASALQMLQSAYDEHDKRIEKEDTPDAMDGLSDSDLETLLKNFNELSAEEQHSLIAYLKKLEARVPARVERLRQYVSDAAHAPAVAAAPRASAGSELLPQPRLSPRLQPPPAQPLQQPRGAPRTDSSLLVLESDDDDYTVEEVFQSATQKVKEDQIRQEMEIVKKSLEEAKPSKETEECTPEAVSEASTTINSIMDITRNLSSASNLFALVQASLKSTSTPTPAPIVQPPEVVSSYMQPRSFGDLPEATSIPQDTALNPQPAPLLRNPPHQITDNKNQPLLSNDHYNQLVNDRFSHGAVPPTDNFNPGNVPLNDRIYQGNQPPDRLNQVNQSKTDRYNQGTFPPNDRFNQGNQQSNDRFNQGNPPPNERFNQGNPPPNERFNQGNLPPNERFNQGNPPPNERFNQGNPPPNERFNPGNPPPNDRFNQGNPPPNERFNQGNPPPNERFNQGNPPPNERFNQGNQPPNDRFNQGNQPSSDRYNYSNQTNDSFNQPPPDRFNSGNPPPSNRFNQGGQPQNDNFNQGNQPQNEIFDQGSQGSQWNARPNNIPLNVAECLDGRAPPPIRGPNPVPLLLAPDNFGPGGLYNQGSRPNFTNNRGHDNRLLNMRLQQFGNYEHQNNFRGRGGRGQVRGGPRGRGRGYY